MTKNRIRSLRKEAGYNQKELGELLGVGQTTVSAWEVGRNEPDNESSFKMAKLFGCSIGYLMGYEDESEHRGLSKKEWDEISFQQHQKRQEEERTRQLGQTTREEDEIEAYLENMEGEEKQKSGEKLFSETYKIDEILERTDADGRRRAVQVINLMFPY